MKKLYIILILLVSVNLYSQVPDKMSYQAVVRDSDDRLVVNSNIGIRISIVKGTPTGSEIYTEVQVPQTNAAGLVSIEIGTGVSAKNFSEIDWSSGPYYIKTEIDPSGGTRYTIKAVSQLLSVPYSMHSKTSDYAKKTEESDPLFINSPAASLTFNDVTSISNKSAFALDYNNLVNRPVTITPEQTQAIEDNSNKGAMTDAERFKLSKVEFGANKNVQADWQAVTGDSYIKNKPQTITEEQANAIRTNSSKNSYPDNHRQKLEGVEVGAQRNVQLDWNATNGDSYIQNKPFTITQEQINSIIANTNKVSYPDADRNKLAGIETGSQRNVQTNWNATSGDAMIINKPVTISPEQATAISRNTLKRSFNDNYKTKLDGIEAGANKNVKANWAANSGDAEILNKPPTITAEQAKNITDGKTKLSGIEERAQVNVQADWNATNGDAFINNKPDVVAIATTKAAERFTNAEKTKLEGIETGANKNVNANWAANSGDAEILNKPTTITTAQANAINANTTKKTYPDADKIKLAGIQAGAEANIQPDWNATSGPAMILNKPDNTNGGKAKSISVLGFNEGTIPYSIKIAGSTTYTRNSSSLEIKLKTASNSYHTINLSYLFSKMIYGAKSDYTNVNTYATETKRRTGDTKFEFLYFPSGIRGHIGFELSVITDYDNKQVTIFAKGISESNDFYMESEMRGYIDISSISVSNPIAAIEFVDQNGFPVTINNISWVAY
ncbi:MAG: hypothetical protein N4A72_21925 [Bacteroidales bacterium]|jgi:hypothetical protein|nr:hypothetical protein [Bacteroidales bacterium]